MKSENFIQLLKTLKIGFIILKIRLEKLKNPNLKVMKLNKRVILLNLLLRLSLKYQGQGRLQTQKQKLRKDSLEIHMSSKMNIRKRTI